MGRRLFAVVAMSVCAAAQPANAQPAPATIEESIAAWVGETAAGIDAFIVAATQACYERLIGGLSDARQQTILDAGAFIAGINALVSAEPDLRETLFPGLDNCGGTAAIGEMMWTWVKANAGLSLDARHALGECLITGVDRLSLDAKRGIASFRYGDFRAAVETMLYERPDLAGTVQEDFAACGLIVEPNLPPMPGADQ
ncbi:MAG: hypothetical protein KIS96_12370 [Bauldia sp.]|nr:hypothetical protein [Bauldia sp.]